MPTETSKDYQRRINKVIDYVFKNIIGDVSLEKLSAVANYSPFHLQRIFKQVTAESPKQYVIRIRLEMAFHFLVIHPHKSVMEIGMSCGFSSASVFSPAFRNYFAITPEQARKLSVSEKQRIMRKLKLNPAALRKTSASASASRQKVEIVRQNMRLAGIYVMAPMDDPGKIRSAFKELCTIALTCDLEYNASLLYGIINPAHGHMYMAFLQASIPGELAARCNCASIEPGKYARISLKGDVKTTMKAIHELMHQWLPANALRIADNVIVYESFSKDPAQCEYAKLNREFHIPIEKN